MNGIKLEEEIWQSMVAFLMDPEKFANEMARRDGESNSAGEINATIMALEGKLGKVDQMETELLGLKLHSQVSEVAYKRQGALLRAERSYYQEEIELQKATLAAVKKFEEGIAALVTVRKRMLNKLRSASPEDKRFVLQCLGTGVIVDREGVKEISVGASPDMDSGVKRSVVCFVTSGSSGCGASSDTTWAPKVPSTSAGPPAAAAVPKGGLGASFPSWRRITCT